MNKSSTFYTLFWMIYFPLCIAFTKMTGWLSMVDETLTFMIIGYTFLTQGKRWQNKAPWKEYNFFLSVLTFYIIYSLIWGRNVAGGIFLDFLQEIRPFSLIYCTWILNPIFTKKQKNILVWTVVLASLARDVTSINYKGTQDMLATGQMAISAGMVWALFKEDTKKNMYISIGLVLLGLVAPKDKFLAEVICFIGVFYIMKKRIKIGSMKMNMMLGLMAVVVLYFIWEKFDQYFISGMDDEKGIARALSLKVGFTQILWDYIPFGPGMGTFACNGAWKYYSPLYHEYGLDTVWGLRGGFICDIFYPSLCQYGIVGIYLFGWFWKRRLTQFNHIVELKYYKVALMAFLCLALEQVADSSWLSGHGMGYCMLIGLCLNANRNQGYTDSGIPIDDDENDEDEEQEDENDEENIEVDDKRVMQIRQ